MRDGVGRDQIFEAEDVLQHVLANDRGRRARAPAPPMLSKMRWNTSEQERAGAAGEVEHGDALVVGEAVADAEALFQNVVHRADDEVHDRRRRVVDAAALARVRVVGLQIVLVEVDERVALEQAMLFLVVRRAPCG